MLQNQNLFFTIIAIVVITVIVYLRAHDAPARSLHGPEPWLQLGGALRQPD